MTMLSCCKLKMLSSKFQRFFSRSTLLNVDISPPEKPNNEMKKIIAEKIKASGPISVAEFMRTVLENPTSYKYSTKHIFGRTVDYMNSLETGQIFGEVIAVWLINEWMKLGAPQPINLMELGPKRGTTMSQVLKMFNELKADKHLSVYMMEMNEALADVQAEQIGASLFKSVPSGACFKMGKTNNDVPVFWSKDFIDIQIRGFTLIFAQEFFGTLPIHKFKKTKDGWREILINFDENNKSQFRYILSDDSTLKMDTLINEKETRNQIEICPDALQFMEIMSDRMKRYGGLSLFFESVHDGSKVDTLKAFHKNTLCDPLLHFEDADLVHDVDFSAFEKITREQLIRFGPISQKQFLKQMNSDQRIKDLIEKAEDGQKRKFEAAYHALLDDDKMGNCFQVFGFLPGVVKEFIENPRPMGFFPKKL